MSRRKLLGTAGLGALAAGVAGAGAGYAAADTSPPPVAADPHALPIPFEGVHQAGIVTPAQDRLYFVALDLTTEDRDSLIALLKQWTAAARQMTQGNDVGEMGAVSGSPYSPPEDTGEALGLPPSGLTITIGFGRGMFVDAKGRPRFGLDGKLPDLLADLPPFVGDRLDPALCGGDLAIQACANDPQIAVHAIRNLVRIAFGRATVRYSQMGFGRTSSTSSAQVTARNLFGFKDGTANIKVEQKKDVDDFVWVHEQDGPDWLVGGSYLVTRKIDMRIEIWDRESLEGQEASIGRAKGSGGPLSGGDEFAAIDLAAKGDDGEPAIAERSHVRLAHPDVNHGAKLLRRGYNFVDGSNGLGQLSAGLFFIAYQRDPVQQFVQIQRSLAGSTRDLLNEYIVHVGSGLFACPPGVGRDGYWGDKLFA
ncbi:iron uptake transporter deferrochelatase/peroxidase subunit [Aeromicrobium wangtongii]|uniref:Deferrochelatase n=1 Tax=Aeromicrobium wangtongii TaxID=2969247 RepID=A0ABY5M5L1_9ACTN|nr:iron uptake transporter deferrochelatase/peroxidase subunit [Aeromicrobium wangtongii]MCD9198858.1 iron uptake transporter deferrochelatase/peroxidase subunit [Aeromicrobium wangtongii]UUP13102.1 iron uptake transporter deferrochelatase/peroxidase subunit [Aeromicrobium wangtongii]